tara:strand:+ start:7447 stop:7974 length:528 start_codon:yes stop_codon:yes gene_type:complete
MSYYVPQMQQRFTGYDSATSLLDAIRIKNQNEATDRRLKIAETESLNRQKLFAQDQATKTAINNALRGNIKSRKEEEAKKVRMAQSGTGGSLPYRMAQWIVDKTPFTYTPKRGWQSESEEERINRESGEAFDYRKDIDSFDDPNIDISQLQPYINSFGSQNLLQQLMLQNPSYIK